VWLIKDNTTDDASIDLLFIINFFIPQVVKIPGVKNKFKNNSVEWLHVRVVRGSQEALAKKNCIKSLQSHAEPLEEELGLAIITRPL